MPDCNSDYGKDTNTANKVPMRKVVLLMTLGVTIFKELSSEYTGV